MQRQLSWVVQTSWLGLQATPILVKSTILRKAVSWLTLADAIWGHGFLWGYLIKQFLVHELLQRVERTSWGCYCV
jgi:hypothetical protein